MVRTQGGIAPWVSLGQICVFLATRVVTGCRLEQLVVVGGVKVGIKSAFGIKALTFQHKYGRINWAYCFDRWAG
jgi:hypothetical protein